MGHSGFLIVSEYFPDDWFSNHTNNHATVQIWCIFVLVCSVIRRAVTRALIGGGGVCSYIHVLPDEFLLKSTLMANDFK